MNKFYTFVGELDGMIYHKYYEDGESKSEVVSEYDYTLYIESHKHNSNQTSLKNKKLKELTFNTTKELKEYYRDNSDLVQIHGNTSPIHQFIAKEYNYNVHQTSPISILNYDIEVEHGDGFNKYGEYHLVNSKLDGVNEVKATIYSIKQHDNPQVYDEEKLEWVNYKDSCYAPKNIGFPDVMKADQPIMSISVKKFGSNNKMYSLGTQPLEEYDNPNGEYILCKNEQELLAQFIKKWREINPDIVTGWNCLPLTNNVWLPNKIVKLSNINYMDKLYNSFVECVYPTSNKKVFKSVLSNGSSILSSKDHIFPILYKHKHSYITDKNSLIFDDKSVGDISELSKDFDVYYKLKLNSNNNDDLTYRNLIKNNYDLLKSKGVTVLFKDTIVVKKISSILKISATDKPKGFNFWADNNIISMLSKKDFINFIDRSKSIQISYDGNKTTRNIMTLILDEVISDDILWLLGMLFTDGTSTYKTEVSVCNNNTECNDRLYNISVNTFKSKQKKPLPSKRDGCTYTNFGLSNMWFFKLFVYDAYPAKSKKELNVELLSQLSHRQFMAFYAGCIDGDGHIDDCGAVILSNYNNQIENISELLQWNGVFNTINQYAVRCYIDSKDFIDNLTINYKRNKVNVTGSYNRTSKSKDMRWFFDNDDVYVRVVTVEELDYSVDMKDISTNTQYFISNGIETHNCTGFDTVYIINRIKKVLGERYASCLSPFYGKVKNDKKLIKEKHISQKDEIEYEIFGVTVLDYIELYKTFNNVKQESYKLDYIGEVEIGQKKVNFDEYGKSLMRLYEGNITVDFKTPYNELDTIMKYARCREIIKLQLKKCGYDIEKSGLIHIGNDVYKFNLDDITQVGSFSNDELKGAFNYCDERVKTLSYKKFIMYNEQDANIVELLDNKMYFMQLALRVVHMAKCKTSEVFGSVAPWDSMIYSRLLSKNRQIPPRQIQDKDEKFGGAYVKDPAIGYHKWVSVFDLKSLDVYGALALKC